MQLTKLLRELLIPLVFATAAASGYADEYPSRPIKLLVGFSAGGATDVSARLFAKKMGEFLGQTIVVENRLGAAGTLAAELVARSPNDGYTLLYTTSSIHGISPHIYKKLSWDPVKDFVPIALAAKYPQVLLANNDLPAKTLPQLLALAKKSANSLSYASAGNGGTQHLAAAMMNAAAGTQMLHVPYKGMSAAYPDLMAGRVQVMFENAPSAIPFINRGAVRALAVSSASRLSMLPDTPTLAESGLPNFEVNAWSGFVAPAGTPRAIINKLNEAVRKSTDSAEVQKWLIENGSPTNLAGSPEDFAAFLKQESAFWKKAVEISGATLE